MANIPNLCFVRDTVRPLVVKKRGGDTLPLRAGRIAAAAISTKAKYFAVRWKAEWHIYAVSGPTALLTVASKDVATMWLLHRSQVNG